MMDFSEAKSTQDFSFSKGVASGTYSLAIDSWKTIESQKVGTIYILKFVVLKGPFEGESFEQLFCVNAEKGRFAFEKAFATLAEIQWAALGGKNAPFNDWDSLFNQLEGKKIVAYVKASTRQNGQYTNIQNEVALAFTYSSQPQNKDGVQFNAQEPRKEEIQELLSQEPPRTPSFAQSNIEDDVPF